MAKTIIDLENGKYTVLEFIRITENSYCGDIIKRLKEYYDQKFKRKFRIFRRNKQK